MRQPLESDEALESRRTRETRSITSTPAWSGGSVMALLPEWLPSVIPAKAGIHWLATRYPRYAAPTDPGFHRR